MGAKGSKATSTGARKYVLKGSKPATTMAAVTDPWADLPPDLARLIAGKLTNICDYTALRSVCRYWRSATGPADHTNKFLPWLIIYHLTSIGSISFTNIADSRTYRPLEAEGKWVYGSSYGWLVMLDPPPDNRLGGSTSVSLLNPITSAQIPLPALPEQMIWSIFIDALLCSHPVSAPPHQLLVAVWNYKTGTLAVLRQADDNWMMFNPGSPMDPFVDIAYFDDALYSIGSDGRLAVLNTVSSTVCQLSDPQPPSVLTDDTVSFNLVESAGNLLLVIRYLDVSDERGPKCNSLLFKLDKSEKGQWKWERVADHKGGRLCSLNVESYTPTSGPRSGYLTYFVPPQDRQEVVDGIVTGKYHYCQTWRRDLWLVPSTR